MVTHFTMRTYGVNQAFRSVKGIFFYIERFGKSENFFSEKIFFTSYVGNMFWATTLYKHHGLYQSPYQLENRKWTQDLFRHFLVLWVRQLWWGFGFTPTNESGSTLVIDRIQTFFIAWEHFFLLFFFLLFFFTLNNKYLIK